MAEDFKKKLDDAKKRQDALRSAKFDTAKGGYVVQGYGSAMSLAALNSEKKSIATDIKNLEAAVRSQKTQPGATSRVEPKALIPEKIELSDIDKQIKALTYSKDGYTPRAISSMSFDELEQYAKLLVRKRDIVANGYTVTGAVTPTQFSDASQVVEETRSLLDNVLSFMNNKTDEGLYTPKKRVEGKGAAARSMLDKSQTPSQMKKTQDRLDRLTILANQVHGGPQMETTPAPTATPAAGTQPAATGGATTAATPTATGTGATTTTGTRTTTGGTRTKAPTAPTGTGTAAGGGTVDVGGKKYKVGSEQWKDLIQKEFGSLWDIYNGNPDVKKVLDKAVKEGWFNDQTKLEAALSNTGWFRTTQQSARQWQIRQSTDPATTENQVKTTMDTIRQSALGNGYTLSDATLRKLATDSIKFDYSDVQLAAALNSEAVADAQLRGAQGTSDLRHGAVARDLYAKAAAYFQKPSQSQIDTWTVDIMKGTKSATQWEDLMRDSARTQFRSLSPALDKGQDVDTAMYAYKQQTGAVLGNTIDVNAIDWTQDKWNKALNYQDPTTKEYRQMDLWEWNKYLRTLPEWQNTQEAKDSYRQVAYALAQGFGKMA